MNRSVCARETVAGFGASNHALAHGTARAEPRPLRVPVWLVTDRPQQTVLLESVLQSETGPVRSATLQLASVGPTTPRDGAISFGTVPPGTYTVHLSARDATGAVLADDALWEKRPAVRAG